MRGLGAWSGFDEGFERARLDFWSDCEGVSGFLELGLGFGRVGEGGGVRAWGGGKR